MYKLIGRKTKQALEQSLRRKYIPTASGILLKIYKAVMWVDKLLRNKKI